MLKNLITGFVLQADSNRIIIQEGDAICTYRQGLFRPMTDAESGVEWVSPKCEIEIGTAPDWHGILVPTQNS